MNMKYCIFFVIYWFMFKILFKVHLKYVASHGRSHIIHIFITCRNFSPILEHVLPFLLLLLESALSNSIILSILFPTCRFDMINASDKHLHLILYLNVSHQKRYNWWVKFKKKGKKVSLVVILGKKMIVHKVTFY